MKKELKFIIFLIIAVVAIIVFSISADKQIKKSKEKFYNSEYSGIIEEITYSEGNRGDPYVLINKEYKVFGPNEDKIRNYVQIGDSVAKIKDTVMIIVFRKDSLNNWEERKFD